MGLRVSVPHCSKLVTMALFLLEAKAGTQEKETLIPLLPTGHRQGPQALMRKKTKQICILGNKFVVGISH